MNGWELRRQRKRELAERAQRELEERILRANERWCVNLQFDNLNQRMRRYERLLDGFQRYGKRHGLWTDHGENSHYIYKTYAVIQLSALRAIRMLRLPPVVGMLNALTLLIAHRMGYPHCQWKHVELHATPGTRLTTYAASRDGEVMLPRPAHKRDEVLHRWARLIPGQVERYKAHMRAQQEQLAEARKALRDITRAIEAARAAQQQLKGGNHEDTRNQGRALRGTEESREGRVERRGCAFGDRPCESDRAKPRRRGEGRDDEDATGSERRQDRRIDGDRVNAP